MPTMPGTLDESTLNRPSVRSRLLVSLAIATAAALMPLTADRTFGVTDTDFSVFWFAGKALLHGQNPYEVIRPGGEYDAVVTFNYPITSGVVAIPFAGFEELHAVTLFVWVSTFLLAYGITSLGWYRLPLFLSVPFFVAVHQAQWSPIFTAAACLPALGWILVAKPNMGLVILAADQSGRTLKVALLGGGAVVLIGFMLVPTWLGDWLAALPEMKYPPPLLTRWGWLSALALLRWKRPEARLIFVLACVPQTAAWYDVLPLFLVAVTFRETLFMAVATSIPVAYELMFGKGDGFLRLYPVGYEWMAFGCLPALIILLRRPNEGELPAWLSGLRRALPAGSFSKAEPRRGDDAGGL